MLFTFFWPKTNLEIQLRIFGSILIVFAESAVNVLVPVYNQKIGKTEKCIKNIHGVVERSLMEGDGCKWNFIREHCG